MAMIRTMKGGKVSFSVGEDKGWKSIADLFLANIKIENFSSKKQFLTTQELTMRKDLNEYLKYLGFVKLEIKKIINEIRHKSIISG